MKPTMLWVGQSKNTKTGNIPQGYVGATREETRESCDGCPMLGNGCYHWQGLPRAAQASMQRAYKNKPKRYSLAHALDDSSRMARYGRGAVGGDPWVFTSEEVIEWYRQARGAGLRGILLYTHFAADKGAHLKGLALASVHTPTEADDRIREGWRAAMVAPYKTKDSKRQRLKDVPVWNGEPITTPDGHEGIVCPAQHKRVDCNSCGLCDAQRTGGKDAPLIIFLQH